MQGRIRVVIYGRVNGNTPDHNRALGVQMEVLRRYARREGWVLAGEFADTVSGTASERPGLSRVLADARGGQYDVLVIHTLDRLSRLICDTVQIHGELERAGVLVLSMSDTPAPTARQVRQRDEAPADCPADPFMDPPTGRTVRLMVQMLAALAAYQRETGRRVRSQKGRG
jgi:hypothetical protein